MLKLSKVSCNLLSALMGRPCAKLHLTFYISKLSQKHGFATVLGEPFNRIQRKWRKIKSQNHLGWKGPLEVVWYNFKAGPGCSCLVQIWVSPRLEIPQPLWAAYASVRPVRANKLGRIQRQTDSSAFQIQLVAKEIRTTVTDVKNKAVFPPKHSRLSQHCYVRIYYTCWYVLKSMPNISGR